MVLLFFELFFYFLTVIVFTKTLRFIYEILQLFEKTFLLSFLYLLFGFQRTIEESLDPSKLNKIYFTFHNCFRFFLLRKEVIHPHVPVGIPCYDLTPIINPTFDGSLHKWLGHRLRVLPTLVV